MGVQYALQYFRTNSSMGVPLGLPYFGTNSSMGIPYRLPYFRTNSSMGQYPYALPYFRTNSLMSVGGSVVVFNATCNSILVISCRSVLLVEETGVPGKNH